MSKVKSTEAYVDGITDFEQAYVAMRNLALDLDREISNRIKDEVLRAAGKSLRKMVSGDDPGNVLAREFLLHNTHLKPETKSGLGKNYQEAAKKAAKERSRLLSGNLKYHTDLDSPVPGFSARIQAAQRGGRTDEGVPQLQGEWTSLANKPIKASYFFMDHIRNGTHRWMMDDLKIPVMSELAGSGMPPEVGAPFHLGGPFSPWALVGLPSLMRYPGASVDRVNDLGKSRWWMGGGPAGEGVAAGVPRLAFGPKRKIFTTSDGLAKSRFIRLIGAMDEGALSLKGWDDLYWNAGRAKQSIMIITGLVHNVIANFTSAMSAVIVRGGGFWINHSSAKSIYKFWEVGNEKGALKLLKGAGGLWGLLCFVDLLDHVIEGTTGHNIIPGHAGTPFRTLHHMTHTEGGGLKTEGTLPVGDLYEFYKKYIESMPVCANDVFQWASNDIVLKNIHRQKEMMSGDPEFTKQIHQLVHDFVMKGIHTDKGGRQSDPDKCYFSHISSGTNWAEEGLTSLLLSSTGFAPNLDLHRGMREETEWWMEDSVGGAPTEDEIVEFISDALLADTIRKAYGEEGTWSQMGEEGLVVYDEDIAGWHSEMARYRAGIENPDGTFNNKLSQCDAKRIRHEETGTGTFNPSTECQGDESTTLYYHFQAEESDKGEEGNESHPTGLTTTAHDELMIQIDVLAAGLDSLVKEYDKQFDDNRGLAARYTDGDLFETFKNVTWDLIASHDSGSVKDRALKDDLWYGSWEFDFKDPDSATPAADDDDDSSDDADNRIPVSEQKTIEPLDPNSNIQRP